MQGAIRSPDAFCSGFDVLSFDFIVKFHDFSSLSCNSRIGVKYRGSFTI
jgi:hypothetical protein